MPSVASDIWSVPVRVPVAVGWKMTFTVQVLPAVTIAPFVQVLAPSRKSPLTVGVLEIVMLAAVPLVSVTGIGELCVPNNWDPAKVSEVGLTLTFGFAPVPLKLTGCAPNTLSVTVRVAVRGLAVPVGENVMFTMHVPVSAGIAALTVQVVPAAIA